MVDVSRFTGPLTPEDEARYAKAKKDAEGAYRQQTDSVVADSLQDIQQTARLARQQARAVRDQQEWADALLEEQKTTNSLLREILRQLKSNSST